MTMQEFREHVGWARLLSVCAVGILSGWVFQLRFVLTAAMASTVNPGALLLVVLSAYGLVTTALAWHRGEPDLTWRGLSVAFMHLVPLGFLPALSPICVWQAVFWVSIGVQTVAKVSLGCRSTVTGPVFVSVRRSGIYRVVRHPMTAAEVVMMLALVCENPVPWNLVFLPFALVAKVAIVCAEESFLGQKNDYIAYRMEVPWRLIPGVW